MYEPKLEFLNLWSEWPHVKPLGDGEARKAEAAFNEVVKDEILWDYFKDKLELVKASKSRYVLSTYLYKLGKSEKITQPVVSAQPAEESESLYQTQNPMSNEELTAFEEAWKAWPPNSMFLEKKDLAAHAWRHAVKEYTLQHVKVACAFYSKNFDMPIYGTANPYYLKTFLTKDDGHIFREWSLRAKNYPTPEEITEFEDTWKWYPPFNDKDTERMKSSSMLYWHDRVKPELRFDFFIAVKSHFHERKDEAMKDDIDPFDPNFTKFNKSFKTFAEDWVSSIKTDYRPLSQEVRENIWIATKGSFYRWVKREGISCPHWSQTEEDVIRYRIQHPGHKVNLILDVLRKSVLCITKEYPTNPPNLDYDIDKVAKELYDESYAAARKLAPGVQALYKRIIEDRQKHVQACEDYEKKILEARQKEKDNASL